MRPKLIYAALAISIGAIGVPAAAADLMISVHGEDGAPLADAVVLIHPAGGSGPASAIHYSWPIVMAQQNISFNPYVLIVPVGSTVGFPNKDKVRHHVYSFSAAKKFELKLYGSRKSALSPSTRAGS